MRYLRVLLLELKQPSSFKIQSELVGDNSFFISFRKQVPLDLLFPATLLEKEGVKVKLIDLNVSSFEKLSTTVKSFKPDLIMLSTGYICYWQCPPPPDLIEENMKYIRASFGGPIGIFGPHSTALPEFILNLSKADFVIRGEAEEVILDVCKKGFENAKGVSYFSNSKLVANQNASLVKFEKLPIPDYDLIDLSSYSEIALQSSRGCPAHCVFCNKTMYGCGYRPRKIADVIKELKVLKAKGFLRFYFQDMEFFLGKKRLSDFCNALIREKLNISWSCTTRVSSVTGLETFKLAKRAGCETINFGLETASEEVLRKSGKGITLNEVEHSMELCSKSGIIGAYNIIFGLPGESRKTMKETLNFIKKHYGQKNVHIDRGFRVIYFPGSRLFDIGVGQGKIKKDSPFSDIYLQSGTINTAFKTKKEFDKAFQEIRIKLFLFKFFRKLKKRIGLVE